MSQQVLLLYRGSLLVEGLKAVLESATDFEVIGIDLDDSDLLRRMRSLHPTVVIIDSSDFRTKDPFIFDLLEASPQLKIVCLRSSDNYLDIYQKRRGTVLKAAELVQIIAAE